VIDDGQYTDELYNCDETAVHYKRLRWQKSLELKNPVMIWSVHQTDTDTSFVVLDLYWVLCTENHCHKFQQTELFDHYFNKDTYSNLYIYNQ
jgi:hypothetical protein